jgi:hypothetical protein
MLACFDADQTSPRHQGARLLHRKGRKQRITPAQPRRHRAPARHAHRRGPQPGDRELDRPGPGVQVPRRYSLREFTRISKDREVVASHHGHTPDQSKPVTPGSATPYTTLVDANPDGQLHPPANHQG